MKCEEAAKLLNGYLDKELKTEDVRHIKEHLDRCKDCFGHLEFDQALREVLKKHSVRDSFSEELKSLIQKKLRD